MDRRVLGDLASIRFMTVDQRVSQSGDLDARYLARARAASFVLEKTLLAAIGNGTLHQDLQSGHLFFSNSAAGIPRGEVGKKGQGELYTRSKRESLIMISSLGVEQCICGLKGGRFEGKNRCRRREAVP